MGEFYRGMWHIWRATCDTLHALAWSSYYYWSIILEYALSIFGIDHFLSCGEFHLVGILHIHPWSW
jgi:hypothetical protein